MASVYRKKTVALLREYLHFLIRDEKILFFYAILAAVCGLTLPFFIQVIVNTIALSELTLNFMVLFLAASVLLAVYFLSRFAQIIILEYAQRKIKDRFVPMLYRAALAKKKKIFYYFEINSIQKYISIWAIDIINISLTTIVGFMALAVYHPVFMVILLIFAVCVWYFVRLGSGAIMTSVAESDQKYKIYYELYEESKRQEDQPSSRGLPKVDQYFLSRHKHFTILRSQIIFSMIVQFCGHLSVLAAGYFLVQAEQLSIGQFVAAEIIATGIFSSLNKAPKFLDVHYSLITSLIKIDSLMEGDKDA